MQKKYAVDMNLKNKIIQEMRLVQQPKMKNRILVCKVLFIAVSLVYVLPTIYLVICAMEQFKMGNVADAWGILSLDILVMCLALILLIVPLCVKQSAEKKYMWKWSSRKDEYVRLQSKSIVWLRYDTLLGQYYWEHQILYKDIKKIEYDVSEKILYVYGYMSGIEWESVNCEECLDTVELDRTISPLPWMTLPAYFENFEELKKNISELSGHEIIEV